MKFKEFLKLVEIQTKIASVFPFFVGLLFSASYYRQVNWLWMLLFFIGMLLFDMATTAINNYQDFVKAKDENYKYHENIIGVAGIDTGLVKNLIVVMVGVSFIIGAFLSVMTGWLFFFLGGLCCLIGIFYTYGPIPLSRMPLGEAFSGVTMGLGIPTLVVYLNTYQNRLFYLTLSSNKFALTGSISAVLALIWACLPLVFTIANIMLANNLRDLDIDIKNHRFTLVFYIGRKAGLFLFQILMLSCYLIPIFGWFFGVFRWPILLIFFTIPSVLNTLKKHREEMPAPISFKRAIDNFLLFNSAYVLSLLVSVIFEFI